MSIKLYGAALSPFVRKTRVALALKGIEFESVHVDPNNPPEGYEKISPMKRARENIYDAYDVTRS